MYFQKSFKARGVLSTALPFQGRKTDLRAELLRVLSEAKTLSRGLYNLN